MKLFLDRILIHLVLLLKIINIFFILYPDYDFNFFEDTDVGQEFNIDIEQEFKTETLVPEPAAPNDDSESSSKSITVY